MTGLAMRAAAGERVAGLLHALHHLERPSLPELGSTRELTIWTYGIYHAGCCLVPSPQPPNWSAWSSQHLPTYSSGALRMLCCCAGWRGCYGRTEGRRRASCRGGNCAATAGVRGRR